MNNYFGLKLAGGFIVVAFLMGVGFNYLIGASCHSQWAKSGFAVEYGFIAGCTISKDGKTFIPADNYREIQ